MKINLFSISYIRVSLTKVYFMKISNEYFAGLFDGEGYLNIRPKQTELKNFQARMGISMTNKKVIQAIQETYGGNLRVQKPRKENYLEQYVWDIYGKKAKNIIENIFPFLIVKKDVASLFIQFINLPKLCNLGRGKGSCNCCNCEFVRQQRSLISNNILYLNKTT